MMCMAWVGQRYLIPLELELKALVNLGMRMLGTELRSSAKSIHTRCRAIFPALTYFQPQQLARTPKCASITRKCHRVGNRGLVAYRSGSRPTWGPLSLVNDAVFFLFPPTVSSCCLLPARIFVQRCQPSWARALLLILLCFNYVFKHPVLNTVTLRGTVNQNNVNWRGTGHSLAMASRTWVERASVPFIACCRHIF